MAPSMVSAERVQAVYDLYISDPSLHYTDVAERLGLSVSMVAHDMMRYRREHGQTVQEFQALKQGKSARTDVQKPGNSATMEIADCKQVYARTVTHAYPVPFRAAVFDLETSDFTATGLVGFLICCSILPLDATQPRTFSIEHSENAGGDRRALEEAIRELSKFDLIIGHYITGFDLPWLRTRADILGLPPLRRWLCYDTYNAARAQQLRTQRKSLAFLLDHFRLDGMKTSIYPGLWDDVRSRDYGAFAYAREQIVEHCELDVQATRELFYRLMPNSWGQAASPFQVTRWAGVPDYSWVVEDKEHGRV